jgi:hypothetical protein
LERLDGSAKLKIWSVALAVPAIGAAMAWFLDDLTAGPGVCVQHDHGVLAVGSILVIAIGPVSVAVVSRLVARPIGASWLAVLISAALGTVLVLGSGFLWAATHGCFS